MSQYIKGQKLIQRVTFKPLADNFGVNCMPEHQFSKCEI